MQSILSGSYRYQREGSEVDKYYDSGWKIFQLWSVFTSTQLRVEHFPLSDIKPWSVSSLSVGLKVWKESVSVEATTRGNGEGTQKAE